MRQPNLTQPNCPATKVSDKLISNEAPVRRMDPQYNVEVPSSRPRAPYRTPLSLFKILNVQTVRVWKI